MTKGTKAKKSSIPGVSFVRKLDGFEEYTLQKNGLRILLHRDTSVSVAGAMVTYHVGSRNEAIGYTGATHLLEHLMFKGSSKFDKEKGTGMDALMEGLGAMINATTWFDRTNYYEVLPSHALPLALEIEADRMRNAHFRVKDRASEMPVVWNEFERGENLPIEALDKQIWATAIQAHPYHHSTIGWRSDIENVSIERLTQFYNDFYWPNNATVTVVGDFDTIETLKNIKKFFGVHPRSPHPIPRMYTKEPPQEGVRRALVRRAGMNMVGIAHKTPEAAHEDAPALIMLSLLLAGEKTSRLNKALVDTALATSVETYCYQLLDPSLFITYVTLAPGVTHEDMEKMTLKVYEDVKRGKVTEAELRQAKRRIRTMLATRRDGAYSLLSAINEELAAGDWTRFVTLPKALEKVRVSDVTEVAKKYFTDTTMTVGWFESTT